ncbi:hypothetical protein D1007_01669 [Hordeum vulgare]|nr:hypothetical protein D1007_01669 [Hordeum vulgare]
MCIFHRKNTKKKKKRARRWWRRRRVHWNLELMALNYPSCSFLVSDECSALMRGCGCWSEEASPLSSPGVNSRRRDDFERDPADLLPVDPFGMNLGHTLTAALASCLDRTVMSGPGRFGSSDGGRSVRPADLSFYMDLEHAMALSREPSYLPAGCSRAFEGPSGFGGLYDARGANCSQGLPALASCSRSVVPTEDQSTSGNAALGCPDDGDDVVGSVPHDEMMYAPSGFGGLYDAGGANCSQGLPPLASCSRSIVPGDDPSTSGNAALGCPDDGDDDVGSAPHDEMKYAPSGFGGLCDAGGANCSQGLPPLASCSCPIVPGEDPSTPGNAALVCRDGDDAVGSAPHDGMTYALRYLGLREILATEMVCKSLHAAIRSVCFVNCMHIEPVLSGKISDPDLLRLTQKIPEGFECLNINDCINITDNGLNVVLQSNLKLTLICICS